ncbi:MAG: hypothetical protein ACRDUV_22705 [Pseudonocardiaceae bacterium]
MAKHSGGLELTWTDKNKALLSIGDGKYDYTLAEDGAVAAPAGDRTGEAGAWILVEACPANHSLAQSPSARSLTT